MPRTRMPQAAGLEAPLTVTAVSMRLGISPSTLRTWERRYGLGPGERTAGSHRRYQPADVARLTRMVELVHEGVSAADAAATVLAQSIPDEVTSRVRVPRSVHDLVALSCRCRATSLREVLKAAVSEEGLVHTWSRLVSPAVEKLRSAGDGEKPGCAPSAILRSAFLDLLAEIATHLPERAKALGKVVILADRGHEVTAHVIGVALGWYGIDARVLASEKNDEQTGSQRLQAHLKTRSADLAIVLGTGTSCEFFINFIASQCGLNVLLVGADAPLVVDGRVLRVRTPAACVEETLALLAPDIDLAAFEA